MIKAAILGVAALAAAVSAVPASAVVTTFAAFGPGGGGANVRFVNAGTSATFYTTATSTATVAGSRVVSFNFLQNAFNSLGTVNARWTLAGSVVNTVAVVNGVNITQSNIAGTFSFLSTSAITLGSTTYAAGSNLLSGTFTNSTLSGNRNGSAAGFSGSTPGSLITYTSDFLTFVPGSSYDFSIALTQITPLLNATPTNGTPNRALRTFRAVAGGQFSSNPAPVPNIPEPAVWMQLIAGFGLVGFAARRRKIAVAA